MIKMIKIECDLITDPEMYIFLEKGERGGISYISNRYSNTNNKKLYGPRHIYIYIYIYIYIIYLDVNNLHGYAISKFLPTSEFKWIDP